METEPFTEYNQGFVDYLFGKELHENPYHGVFFENEEDLKKYVLWFDGWKAAEKSYPTIEELK